eukprot:GHVR01002935.1.p1 GENE.GHVR01002935.1~~GHVR01002935.1.p1  ORF type:complete len:124 (+),score=22.66 GHVR01002935.1:192-563(+)
MMGDTCAAGCPVPLLRDPQSGRLLCASCGVISPVPGAERKTVCRVSVTHDNAEVTRECVEPPTCHTLREVLFKRLGMYARVISENTTPEDDVLIREREKCYLEYSLLAAQTLSELSKIHAPSV